MASSDRRTLPGGFTASSRPIARLPAAICLLVIAAIFICIGTAAAVHIIGKTPANTTTPLNLNGDPYDGNVLYPDDEDTEENETEGESAASPVFNGSITFASGMNDTELESGIVSAMDTAYTLFAGAGLAASGYEVVVFNLITDPDLADPGFEGKPLGLKITLLYDPALDKIQDTDWGHEFDASRIVQEYYTGDLEDDIGFVAVFYRFTEEKDWRVKLILEAADAGKFDGNWDEEHYIQKIDWTVADFDPNEEISAYEEPSTRMEAGGRLRVSSGTTAPTRKMNAEEFQSEMFEVTSRLTDLVNEIAVKSIDRDYASVTISAQDLAEYSRNVYEEMSLTEVPDSYHDIQDTFLEGIADYQRAGSAYWFGAAMTNADKFKEGNELIKSGMLSLNNALGSIGLKEIEVTEYIMPASGLYPEALDLNEPFKYQDAKKVNDISVNVELLTYREGYSEELADGSTNRVTAGYGNKFVIAIIDVTHLGFRGGGSEKIKTPKPGEFILIYQGEEYKQSTPTNFIRSVGFPYKQVTLNRKEHYEGALFFEVPEGFDPKDAYIKLNLGTLGTGIWKLG